jgi:hypothetical protein
MPSFGNAERIVVSAAAPVSAAILGRYEALCEDVSAANTTVLPR